MASRRLETTWRHLCSLLDTRAAEETADAQLLARFVAERDDAAFAELVRRHSPLVYGVCRRVLANPHDAEDAGQATFLILSRKAASIRRGESLSCWLHHVALHAAVRLKRNIRSRKDRTTLPPDVPQPENDPVSWREVQRLVDEELARLPDQFRQPLILCYLEGKTRDEAAEELGWSLSTFRGRLERGRERLRWRLEKRGLALSAALLATLAVKSAHAAIALTTTASQQAAALATEVTRTMFLGKLKALLLWCVVLLLLGGGGGMAAYRYGGGDKPATPPVSEVPPVAKPAKPPEEDGVVKDFKAHLDEFRLTITLRPQQLDNLDTRYPVSDLRLHVSPGPFGEPGGTGTAFARITKEQAAKIVDVFAKNNFFRASIADGDRLMPPRGNYVELVASYRKDDKSEVVRRWVTHEWNLHMVQQLEAIRACVDGEAAKALDKMLKSLKDEHKEEKKNKLLKIERFEDLDALWAVSDGPAVAKPAFAKDVKAERAALDGVLPFKMWPKPLTDEQRQLRSAGLKLANQWLDQQTMDFHPTRGPNFGEALRYSDGFTKVTQEWKGEMPSERYAKNTFHINVLLIQEGYSPFVRSPKELRNKTTLACYESAEQYAAQHKKGIWKDAEFAARLKKIAEKWDGRPEAQIRAQWLEELFAQMPVSKKAPEIRYELAETYRLLADEQDRLLNDGSTDKTQQMRDHLSEVRDRARTRATEEYETLIATVKKPDPTAHLDDRKIRNVYYFAAYVPFQMTKYEKSLAAFELMAERYKGKPDYWTAVAGQVSAYTGLNDQKRVREGLETIRKGFPDMDPGMREAMEQYVRDVERALEGFQK